MKLRAERRNHVIETAHNLTGERIVDILKDLIARDGAPAFIRSDNGPECIAREVRDRPATQNIETAEGSVHRGLLPCIAQPELRWLVDHRAN